MEQQKFSHYLRPGLLLILTASLLFCRSADAGRNDLLAFYTQLKPVLENNVYGIPVYISSSDENNTMTGNIYGVIDYPYAGLVKAIKPPASWCDIAPQHLNIKACTYQVINHQCQLTFYTGRKFYEKADDVYQLTYQFHISEQLEDFIHLQLLADDGPAGTSHYRLNIKAIPLDKDRSFIQFSYSYQYNFITSMGMSTYLATLGRGKLGFTIIGNNAQAEPVYIEGVRGIIERNAVRYYLAIKSYLATLHMAAEQRFTARITNWFELTEQYHKQLYEMDKTDYLTYKKQERLDQRRLQQNIKIPVTEQGICQ